MGLHHIIKNDSENSIAIWKIEESLNELEELVVLSSEQKVIYLALPTQKRKKEWLVVRHLLQILIPEQTPLITYESSGKPTLSSDHHLSISHSNAYVAIIINKNKAVGIDIQTPKQNIKRTISFFMSPKEQNELGNVDIFDKIHLYWCAKETLYKLVGDNTLNIYTHFSLHLFEINDIKTLIGCVNHLETDVLLHYDITQNYYLVYTSA